MIIFDIYEVNGKEIMAVNSLDLVNVLGKGHNLILRDLRNLMLCKRSIRDNSRFIKSCYFDRQGREQPAILVTLEGLVYYMQTRHKPYKEFDRYIKELLLERISTYSKVY